MLQHQVELNSIQLPIMGMHITWYADDRQNAAITSDRSEIANDEPLCIALDTVESMVLAHFCAGVDVESEAYIKGCQTSFDAIAERIPNQHEQPSTHLLNEVLECVHAAGGLIENPKGELIPAFAPTWTRLGACTEKIVHYMDSINAQHLIEMPTRTSLLDLRLGAIKRTISNAFLKKYLPKSAGRHSYTYWMNLTSWKAELNNPDVFVATIAFSECIDANCAFLDVAVRFHSGTSVIAEINEHVRAFDVSWCTPFHDLQAPSDSRAFVEILTRPYFPISESDYKALAALSTTFVELPNGIVCTFGTADSSFALMPIKALVPDNYFRVFF